MLLVTALKLYWIELDSMELEQKDPVQTFMNLNLPVRFVNCAVVMLTFDPR